MIYVVTINNKKYEVEVEKGQASIVSTKEAVTAAASATHAVQSAPAAMGNNRTVSYEAAAEENGETIKAPMPGTVLDIKASEGANVKKGDVLFIIEAMKMENEILALNDGTVVRVNTAMGSYVSTGDVLAVIRK